MSTLFTEFSVMAPPLPNSAKLLESRSDNDKISSDPDCSVSASDLLLDDGSGLSDHSSLLPV